MEEAEFFTFSVVKIRNPRPKLQAVASIVLH